MLVEPFRRRAQERDQDEDAPESINDAGNRRQKLDDVLQSDFPLIGEEILRQEDRDGHAEQRPQSDAQNRAVESTGNLRRDAEGLVFGTPLARREKIAAVIVDGGRSGYRNLDHQQANYADAKQRHPQ